MSLLNRFFSKSGLDGIDISSDFAFNSTYITSGRIEAYLYGSIVFFIASGTGTTGSILKQDDMQMIKYNGSKTIEGLGILTMPVKVSADGQAPHLEACSWNNTTKYITVSNRTAAGRYIMMEGFFRVS